MWSSFAGFSTAANAFNSTAQCGGLGFCGGAEFANAENPPLVFPNAGVLPGEDSGEAGWEEVDLYRKANWYPDEVEQYAKGCAGETPSKLEEKVRLHLACLGWKIELNNKGKPKFRYTRPIRRRVYHSLREVCRVLVGSRSEVADAMVPDNDHKEEEEEEVPNLESAAMDEEEDVPNSQRAGRRRKQEELDKFDAEPRYDPEAVLEWIELKGDATAGPGKSGDSTRVKKHLLSVGWDLFYIKKSSGGSELRYRAPPPFDSKAHISLVSACDFLVKQGLLHSVPMRRKPVPPIQSQVQRRIAHDTFGIGTEDGSTILGKRNQSGNIGDTVEQRKPNCGDDERKRSKVGGASNAMTASLIDNNLVEEMAPVYYRSRKGDLKLKQGWVTRAGIKCECCNEVFNLTAFEAHAGSTNHRPAANIILQDGMSLFQLHNQWKGVKI